MNCEVEPVEPSLDEWSNFAPIKAAGASKWWQCDRVDVELGDHGPEVVEPSGDVRHPGLGSPGARGWKSDDPVGPHELTVVESEHLAQRNLIPFACSLVGLELGRERVLELQGDALAHDPDRVHGVDERVRLRFKEVAGAPDESSQMAGAAARFHRADQVKLTLVTPNTNSSVRPSNGRFK